jgi:hypothetical protein
MVHFGSRKSRKGYRICSYMYKYPFFFKNGHNLHRSNGPTRLGYGGQWCSYTSAESDLAMNPVITLATCVIGWYSANIVGNVATCALQKFPTKDRGDSHCLVRFGKNKHWKLCHWKFSEMDGLVYHQNPTSWKLKNTSGKKGISVFPRWRKGHGKRVSASKIVHPNAACT